MQRDADAYELGIADIYISNGVISITQANITDLRLNNELCGIVHGTVNQIDATNLFAQYDAEFRDWFAGLEDVLDENVAANLLNLINAHKAEKANLSVLGHVNHAVLTATLNTAWLGTSAPYTKTVSVSGILFTDTPIIDVVMSGTYSTDEARIEAWGYIYRAVCNNGSITFYATEKPTVSLPIQIKVVR